MKKIAGRNGRRGGIVFALALLGACSGKPSVEAPADLLLTNGYVYTADAARSVAQAVAVRDGVIVYVGDVAGAEALANAATQRLDLGGRMLLPGLHDAHIHPLGIVAAGVCDLDSEPLPLADLVLFLNDCVARLEPDAGWLIVDQWNFTAGNQPDARYTNLRVALDAVSKELPIVLLGNDGHHGAANSATLALARAESGATVGISAATIDSDFAAYREYIGVDANGEPNGLVNETARDLFGIPASALEQLPGNSTMPLIAQKLAMNGITSVRDAAAREIGFELYNYLADSGQLTFRLTLALFPDFDSYRNAEGVPDIAAIISDFDKIRDRYRSSPLIKADTAKIFVDGVIEGDPLSTPPTLPNAAQLQPYLQPRFSFNAATSELAVNGYVATDSEACLAVRRDPGLYANPALRDEFFASHGFYAAQCNVSRGVLEHPESFIEAYVRALDNAGYTIHAHAIGDRAVRVATAAFSKVRLQNGRVVLPHGMAHAQLVHPDDVQRIGALGLNIAFTFAWTLPDYFYDLTVVPFIDKVTGADDLYNPDHYTWKNSYPAESLRKAGTLITGGSDAPVDSREPRPFLNIERAVTRANDAGESYNPSERLDIHEAIAAYTINSALALNQAQLVGTIETGKRADLALLDQNIVELAEGGNASAISETKVLLTVFDGKVIYRDPALAND
ncbi:MAG: amidohydrolase family protein [Woeseia sp.]